MKLDWFCVDLVAAEEKEDETAEEEAEAEAAAFEGGGRLISSSLSSRAEKRALNFCLGINCCFLLVSGIVSLLFCFSSLSSADSESWTPKSVWFCFLLVFCFSVVVVSSVRLFIQRDRESSLLSFVRSKTKMKKKKIIKITIHKNKETKYTKVLQLTR